MNKKIFGKTIAILMAFILILGVVPIRGQAHDNGPAESFSLYKDGHMEKVLDVDSDAQVQRAPIGSSSHFSYDAEHNALKISNIKITRGDTMVYLDNLDAIYVSGDCKLPVIRMDCLSEDFYGNPPIASSVTVYMDPGSRLEVGDIYDRDMKDVNTKIVSGPGVKMKAKRDGKAMQFIFTSGGLKVGKKAKVKGVQYKIIADDGVSAEVAKGKAAKKVKVGDTVKIKGYTYKITSIGKGAYKNKKSITEVTLGSNIQSIKKDAFSGCAKLKKITICAGNLKSIEKNAFKKLNKNCEFVLTGTDEEIARADLLIRNSATGFKDTMTVKGY